MQVYDLPGSLLVHPPPDQTAAARLWTIPELERDQGRPWVKIPDAKVSHLGKDSECC